MKLLHTLFWLVLLSFVFHLTWELAQSPLYTCSVDMEACFWICVRATFGDVGIMLVLYGIHQKVPSLWKMALIGAALATVIEKTSIEMERWFYFDTMPLIPGIEVGLTPILQMALIPPLVFYILRINKLHRESQYPQVLSGHFLRRNRVSTYRRYL